MVAMKKIANAFDNHMDAKRTLRGIKLLRHFNHENIATMLMDTDLHQIIRSNQGLSEEPVRWYRAPELLWNSSDYTVPIDVWSVGCIFTELTNRKPLFPGKDHVHQMCLLTELKRH